MNDIICIVKTYDTFEADLVTFQLEAAGIPCYLKSDNVGGMLPHLSWINGLGIMIHLADEQRAWEILDERKEIDAGDDDISLQGSFYHQDVMWCLLLVAIPAFLFDLFLAFGGCL
ncbi:MAG: putative signal transducing protein [Waddliaceae bacterium]